MIIKSKKNSEKTPAGIAPSADSPPGLSHSLPTSATFSDPVDRTRSASIDSQLSLFDFNAPPTIADYTAYNAQMHSSHSQYAPMYQDFSSYEVDVKTERQMFINDVPTRRESTISTFSTFHPPPPEAVLPSFPEDQWATGMYDERRDTLGDESLNMNLFDFCHAPTNARQLAIDLDEADSQLLDHFIANVVPTIFPILELSSHNSARTDLVLPALATNVSYLHCCLSISAQHLKATMNLTSEQIDNDIMRHRYATISSLCAALNTDEDHQSILEATLGMIFFPSVVGAPADSLPDIPWHQHFQAAISLVQKLDLPNIVTSHTLSSTPSQSFQPPFNMTLTAWVDILGATLQGNVPTFADTYRNFHLSPNSPSLGLRELMGCDDKILFLISEIACLESLKNNNMDHIQLCQCVHSVGASIGLTEAGQGQLGSVWSDDGTLRPAMLGRCITQAFTIAARIYLCSLVPGFVPSQESCIGLVERLVQVLEFIPSGPDGFDRSLVWVYLIAGSVASKNSRLRALFEERVLALGASAEVGSFGKLAMLLREVWAQCDGADGGAYVSWRDVMQSKGWDFLLI
jgi:hypothetical protein